MDKNFPQSFLGESELPSWMLLRPEGHDLSYTAGKPWRVAYYLRKYRKKKFSTPLDSLSHFNTQRSLLRALVENHDQSQQGGGKIRLSCVGDLMWVRTNWSSFLDPGLKAHLESSDLVFGNLETPIDRNSPPVEWYKVDAFTFNSHPQLLEAFRRENSNSNIFSALSFANNHTFDRADDGARRTLEFLEELQVPQSGLRENSSQSPITIIDKNGFRIGFYACCYGYNNPSYRSSLLLETIRGLAPFPNPLNAIDLGPIEEALQEMDHQQVDFRMISIHWGHEFELYPTAYQVQLGQKLAAMGFDLVAGSHPHVVQPSEICFLNGYEKTEAGQNLLRQAHISQEEIIPLQGRGAARKSLIHYSLGNFSTAMLFWETKFGAIQSLEVFRDGQGRVDWHNLSVDFIYNLLSIHNDGKKELILLRDYLSKKENALMKDFPRNRRVAGFLFRHLLTRMPPERLSHGLLEEDFQELLSWLRSKGELRTG